MKYVAIIPIVLAVSQCPSEPKEEPKASPDTAQVDAGEAPDVETADAVATDVRVMQLEPGPPPFDVPTRRIVLRSLDASMLVPVGTRTERTGDGVSVKFGEGKNFWVEVEDRAVDLADVRARFDSETDEPVDRYEDAVVWNVGEHWFFQYSGALSCANPATAMHDLRDVDVMVAACRSIETEDPSNEADAGAPSR